MGLFENYSQTNETKKNGIRPIRVKKNPYIIFDEILKYLEDEGFENISSNKVFYEIYAHDYSYELSFFIAAEQDGYSVINIAAYKEKKIGSTKKEVKRIKAEIESLFNLN